MRCPKGKPAARLLRLYGVLDSLLLVGWLLSLGEGACVALLGVAAASGACGGGAALAWAAFALSAAALLSWLGRLPLAWSALLASGGKGAWEAHARLTLAVLFHRRLLWPASVCFGDGPLPIDGGDFAQRAAEVPAALQAAYLSNGLSSAWVMWAMQKQERAARDREATEEVEEAPTGPPPTAADLRSLSRALRYSVAAYTGSMLDYGRGMWALPPFGPLALTAWRHGTCAPWAWRCGPAAGAVRGDNAIGGHERAFSGYLRRAGIRGELLEARLPLPKTPTAEHSHWYLHADDEAKTLVLVVRGSSRALDCLVDSCFRPVRWQTAHGGAWTHGGAADLASAILRDVGGSEKLRGLLQLGGRCAGYALLLTGHSLGGAVATLLALRLQDELADILPTGEAISCIAISPMPCLDVAAAAAAVPLVTSVVYNREIVPFLDLTRIAALLATSARAVDNDGGGRQKPPPGVSRASCVGSLLSLGTQCACGSCRGAGVAWQRCEFGADGRCDVGSAAPPLVVLPEGDAAPDAAHIALDVDAETAAPADRRAERTAAAYDALRASFLALHVPGRVVHVRRAGGWGGRHTAEWVPAGGLAARFAAMRPLRPHALVDHVPMRLEAALRELLLTAHRQPDR